MQSRILTQTLQADGTTLIQEQHIASSGEIFSYIYFIQDTNIAESACQLRGIAIQADIDSKAQALALSTNYEIPLSDIEIMRRLTPQEWSAFQDSTDISIQYFKDVFAKAKTIYRNDPLTQAGFNALITAGILTISRKAEVLA